MSISCENCRERLVGFLYEELDADERIAMELALEQCPECRRELDAMRAVANAYDNLPRPEFPEKRTLDLIREARLAADARRSASRAPLWLGSLASLAAIGVVGLVLVLRDAAPESTSAESVALAPSAPVRSADTAATSAAAPSAGDEIVAVVEEAEESEAIAPSATPRPLVEAAPPAQLGGVEQTPDIVARGGATNAAPSAAEPLGPSQRERQQLAESPAEPAGSSSLAGGRTGADSDRLAAEDTLSLNAPAQTQTANVVAPAPAPSPPAAPVSPGYQDMPSAAAYGAAATTSSSTSVNEMPSAERDALVDEVAIAEEEAGARPRRERRRDSARSESSESSSTTGSADGDWGGAAYEGEAAPMADAELDSAVAASLFDEATRALQRGEFLRADENFAAFLELARAGDARIAAAYLGRAHCAAGLGRPDSARAFIESMLSRSPTDAQRREAEALLDQLDDAYLEAPINRTNDSAAEPPAP